MTTPNIIFKYTGIEVDYTLQSIMTQKMTALEKYFKSPTTIEVEFRKDAPKESGDVYVVEVNCTVKSDLYRAVSVKNSFEIAIDQVRNELDKELRRARKKRNNLFIKGARRIKEMVRWGK